jgi:hypothetical protein
MKDDPVVGAWYETEDGEVFKVLNVDAATGSVEIEYDDGAVDELDMDEWRELDAEEVESSDEDEDEEDAEDYDEDEDVEELDEDEDFDEEEDENN